MNPVPTGGERRRPDARRRLNPCLSGQEALGAPAEHRSGAERSARMNCPACGNGLTTMDAGSVEVDVCKGGCGGIWFDARELKKVDEQHESVGATLLDVERNPAAPVNPNQRLKCPKCDDVVMMRHFTSLKREVEIDECPNCGGAWLDLGELARLRGEFATEVERKKAASDYFSQSFDGQLAIMRVESESQRQRARWLTRVFTFFS
jgi:Zn-finger nucleic acid-binding protein